MNERSALLKDNSSWSAAAAKVLRASRLLAEDAPDSAAWETLQRHTVEGVPIPPMGTARGAEAAGLPVALAADPGVAPYLRGSKPEGSWDVRARVALPDPLRAHALAQEDLAGGANSLWVVLGEGAVSPADLADVLDGVDATAAPVVVDARAASDRAVLAAADALEASVAAGARAIHPASSLGFDPIGRHARRTLLPITVPDACGGHSNPGDLVQIAGRAQALGIGALVVDATAVHDAGAAETVELAYSLAAGASYLRALTAIGFDIDTACALISFRYAATDEQFLTIAKLRAARFAWHRVAELSGASVAARRQRQHAVTSAAMMTRYDPYVNVLRTTVAAFAAGTGGAEAVTVLPFDSARGSGDEFSHRMARNVSALLLGESYAGAVADPAGGAHAVEMLTGHIAQQAWSHFVDWDEKGLLDTLSDGSLAASIAATREERNRRISTRRRPITGISEFPDAHEQAPPTPVPSPADAVARWAQPFEALRDDPAPRPVLLKALGTPASASPRLLFAQNLLAAGGVAVREVGDSGDLASLIHNNAPGVVVFAGNDRDYATALPDAVHAARAAGASAIFVAGRPTETLAQIEDGFVDATVATGDDVLAFVELVRGALKGTR